MARSIYREGGEEGGEAVGVIDLCIVSVKARVRRVRMHYEIPSGRQDGQEIFSGAAYLLR